VKANFAESMDQRTQERLLLPESKGGKISVTRCLQASSSDKETSIYQTWLRGGGFRGCSRRVDAGF